MPHISYSELKNWCHCPYYHKLVNIDKIKHFEGNEYTAFGTALHSFCEHLLTKQITVNDKAFFIKEMQEVSSEGGFRQAAIHCTDYVSEKNKVEFSLSRGSFATILLREIMKPSDPILAGF